MPKKVLRTAISEIKGNLHEAAAMGDVEQMTLLLQNGRSVADLDTHQATPLHYACRNGKVQAVQHLLRQGADFNARTDAGITPLMCAANNNHESIVSELLTAGNFSSELLLAESDSEHTAMDYAVMNHHFETSAALARLMLPFTTAKDLFEAVEINDVTYIKCTLLLNKISPNLTNGQGQTLLMVACTKHFAAYGKLLRYLLAKPEVDLNAVDQRRNTALLLAVKNASAFTEVGIIKAMVERDQIANCNHTDDQGMTAFHWATALELAGVVEVLLKFFEERLDVKAKDHLGRTWVDIVDTSHPRDDEGWKLFVTALLPKNPRKAKRK